MRVFLVISLLLAGCGHAPPPAAEKYGPDYPPPLRFRACQPLAVSPPPLPVVRTIEMLRDQNKALSDSNDEWKRRYLDCAERMRLAVEAYDTATKRNQFTQGY